MNRQEILSMSAPLLNFTIAQILNISSLTRPDYARNLTDAITLIDSGYDEYLYDISSTYDSVLDRYRARIFPLDMQSTCCAWGETIPLAVCRVWLIYQNEVSK